MILTVTPNPSLDRTVELSAALHRGQVQRATHVSAEPGGKGVNISRALAASKIPTTALLPGRGDDPVLRALSELGIDYDAVPIDGAIRSNITLTEPDGTTTKVNEPGPVLNETQRELLITQTVAQAQSAQWLVLAGSLPPGVEPDFYAHVIRRVRTEWGQCAPRIAVDSSGEPLKLAVQAGPDLIKPNTFELAELLGLDEPAALESQFGQRPASAEPHLRSLLDSGVGAILLTLGEYGALYANHEGIWFAKSPRIQAKSTVGAGDAALAGFLYASIESGTPEQRLQQAVAHGSAAAALPGSTMPEVAQTTPDTIRVQPMGPTGQRKEFV